MSTEYATAQHPNKENTMKRKVIERYSDMKTAIDNIWNLIENQNHTTFKYKMNTNSQFKSQVFMNFLILGEAIRSILNTLKKQNQHIHWRRFIYFRNSIVHQYYKTADNAEKIWDCYKGEDMVKIYSFTIATIKNYEKTNKLTGPC